MILGKSRFTLVTVIANKHSPLPEAQEGRGARGGGPGGPRGEAQEGPGGRPTRAQGGGEAQGAAVRGIPTHKNKIWHNGRVHAGIQTKLSQNDTLVWHMHEFEPNYTVFKYMSGLCTKSKQKNDL